MIEKLKNGTAVTKTGEQGVWSHIEAQGKSGYIMSQYLVPYKDSGTDTITISRKRLEDVYDEIGDLLGMRG